MRITACCILLLLLAASAGAVSPGDGGSKSFDLESWRQKETLRMSGTQLALPKVSPEELASQRSGSGAAAQAVSSRPSRNIAVAMISSAVLPGAGQLYMATATHKVSHWARVPVFLGLDIWFWYAYRDNYDKGKDVKAEYERFADAHWTEERFLLQHPYCDGIGGCDSWQQYNEEAEGRYYFVYIPRELDHEEYYENLGKYDAFCFGWDDWNGDHNDVEAWTPNRTEYWDMRSESDDYLLTADRYVMALIVNRVVSMLDAGWLAYRYNRGAYDDGRWTIDFRPGYERSQVGLRYRF